MKIQTLICLSIVSGLLAGCTGQRELHSGRWSGEGDRPSLPAVNLNQLDAYKVGFEKVQLSEQKWNGFALEGAFVKTIVKDEEIVFQSFALAEKVPQTLIAKAKLLDLVKEQSWHAFLYKNPQYHNWKIEQKPKVVILTEDKIKPVLTSVISNHAGEAFQVQFSEYGTLVQETRLGSHLEDLSESSALVFPKGPKKSNLSKVLLSHFNVPEILANNRIELKTESPLKIVTGDLEIPPTDERFEQIQAYYFANKILQWFESKLSIQGPLKIGILTQMGYPEKTNTAFYFNGSIRLGSGDEEVFSRIPWDPSIVMHEVSHAVIDALSRLPFQGEGGSLNEGFADVFTTFYLESPNLGENAYKLAAFKRTVSVPVRLPEKNAGLYHDSAIVSSFFWHLKNQVGADKALQLALKTLVRLGPGSRFQDFVLSVKEQAAVVFNGPELLKVQDLIKDWGFL